MREVEDDDRVSKFISRNYGDGKQLSGRKSGSAALKSKIQQEAEQEQSDKDSLFTQSQDHTSTSEAGTNSSLEEDSPRLKQRSSFKYTKLPPNSAPARSHQLPSPSSTTSPFLFLHYDLTCLSLFWEGYLIKYHDLKQFACFTRCSKNMI